MAALFKKLLIAHDLVYNKLPDPRSKSWPFVVDMYVGIATLVLYAVLVLNWGPKWMKNRPPYNIDKILIIYNIVQIVACAYIFIEMLVYAWAADYQWVCEPVDYSDTPRGINAARFVYHYYLMKYVDLLDTVFFILRKKFNQVSFLHVYHHVNMVAGSWGALTYLPGGHGTFIALVNSFVHVVMYSYYLLTVINPATKQSMWWKKHVTELQIVQLTSCCIYLSLVLIVPNCAFPPWTAVTVVPTDFFLLILFIDFYIKNYIKVKPQSNDAIKIEQHAQSVEDHNNFSSEKDVLRKRTVNGPI